jgi:hypothetical protein
MASASGLILASKLSFVGFHPMDLDRTPLQREFVPEKEIYEREKYVLSTVNICFLTEHPLTDGFPLISS